MHAYKYSPYQQDGVTLNLSVPHSIMQSQKAPIINFNEVVKSLVIEYDYYPIMKIGT